MDNENQDQIRSDEQPPYEQDVAETANSPSENEVEDRPGYGNPPRETRFKPGVSGNLKGRPKRRQNFGSLIHDAALQPVTVSVGGEPKRMPIVSVAINKLVAKAAQGDIASMKLLTQLMRIAEAAPAEIEEDDGALREESHIETAKNMVTRIRRDYRFELEKENKKEEEDK